MNRSMELTNNGCRTATERPVVVPSTLGRQRMINSVRWISSLLIAAALLTIIRVLPIDQAMGAIQGWTAGLGIWGPVVLALVSIVATVLFVPGTILTLAAGGMFGLLVRTITVSIGSTRGASLAFLIARYVARDKVAARAGRNRRFGASDRAIGEGDWKIVALLRLSPAIPFNLQNYLYGLTPIRFRPYVLTSWLAMLPGTFLYVYLGHIAGAAVGADRSRTAAEWVMLAVGLPATVVVTVYVTRLTRRKLHEQMNDAAEEETTPVPEADAQRASGDGARLRGALMLAGVALVMTGTAVALVANATIFARWLTGPFGPPRVESIEAYGAAVAESGEAEATFDHSALDALLRRHVDADGWFD